VSDRGNSPAASEIGTDFESRPQLTMISAAGVSSPDLPPTSSGAARNDLYLPECIRFQSEARIAEDIAFSEQRRDLVAGIHSKHCYGEINKLV
jgi:hypothetical protein